MSDYESNNTTTVIPAVFGAFACLVFILIIFRWWCFYSRYGYWYSRPVMYTTTAVVVSPTGAAAYAAAPGYPGAQAPYYPQQNVYGQPATGTPQYPGQQYPGQPYPPPPPQNPAYGQAQYYNNNNAGQPQPQPQQQSLY